jgi:hypothetical protein
MTSFFMPCPLCGERSQVSLIERKRAENIDCPSCGAYVITCQAKVKLHKIQGDALVDDIRDSLTAWTRQGFVRCIEFNADKQEFVINILPQ